MSDLRRRVSRWLERGAKRRRGHVSGISPSLLLEGERESRPAMLEGPGLPEGGRYRLHRLRWGGIGWAAMTPDRTIVLDIHLFDSLIDVLVDRAIAYPPTDPRHAEVAAHVGGLEPGEMKPIRQAGPWCLGGGEAAGRAPA